MCRLFSSFLFLLLLSPPAALSSTSASLLWPPKLRPCRPSPNCLSGSGRRRTVCLSSTRSHTDPWSGGQDTCRLVWSLETADTVLELLSGSNGPHGAGMNRNHFIPFRGTARGTVTMEWTLQASALHHLTSVLKQKRNKILSTQHLWKEKKMQNLKTKNKTLTCH